MWQWWGSGSGEAQGSQPLLAFPMVTPTLPQRLSQWASSWASTTHSEYKGFPGA